ncbi:PREDICTED: uncharacterized protein LOC107099421 [Cyprinodon variegatus]|uniref:uncharacterized protein LOC107099421 n=1 Tax=Cyprinodon variegatus TaxID=28743 RepID=UPI00074271AE|nr:PREDICTED: uncharacterized protein LOC107099421 [Cyprinodon variegatus]
MMHDRMRVVILIITLNTLLFSGSSLSNQVRQTPLYIQANPGNSANINCSHSIQNYNVMLWYKRSEDRQLQLLGYRYLGSSTYESGAKVEIEGSADKDKNCTLTIKELSVSSSAVYFCAASYHSSSLSDQVYQTPFYIAANPGQNASINCSHSIRSYNRIFWYKKSEHRQLQFLGYTYQTTSNAELGVNVSIKGNAAEGDISTLTIKELTMRFLIFKT